MTAAGGPRGGVGARPSLSTATSGLNPYARTVADEARRRVIGVEVLDAEWGELRLWHGGRSIVTRESLSELTSAVAMTAVTTSG